MTRRKYKETLKDILSNVCDAKAEVAIQEIYGSFAGKIIRSNTKLVIKRYLELVKEELGL